MRRPRIKISGEAYYHLYTRTAGQRFLLTEECKKVFLAMLRKVEAFCGLEVLTYCLMDNHIHLLVHVPEQSTLTEKVILERVAKLYGSQKANALHSRWKTLRAGNIPEKLALFEKEINSYRKRMGDITPFMKTLKERFSIWYRANHDYVGTLWQGRFGSTLIESTSNALETVAAYIDLNPVRAHMVDDPADYRWSGYGAASTGNVQAQMGLARIYNVKESSQTFTTPHMETYRKLLYLNDDEATPSDNVENMMQKSMDIPSSILLRNQTRAFLFGKIIGSKEFVTHVFTTLRLHPFGIKRKFEAAPLYPSTKSFKMLYTA